MIEFALQDVKVPGLNPELFVLWLEETVIEEGFVVGDIALVFCSDDYLLDMNKQYLNHDYYTDIITFDYTENEVVSGDLFISIDRIIDNSNVLNTDYDQELRRVCVHGVLHLCGYKDKTEEEVVLMRSKEDYYLQKFVSRGT
jgi:rRNA maturation RNase YbeY